jgi:plastocyanin
MFWGLLMTAPAAPRRHAVLIEQFQYKPVVIRAVVGDTIVWENRDIVPHTADANDKAWKTGNMNAQAKAITVVTRRGTTEFTCLYHSNMKGTLIVK